MLNLYTIHSLFSYYYYHLYVTYFMQGYSILHRGNFVIVAWHRSLSHSDISGESDEKLATVCDGNNKANLRDLIAATGLVISNWIQIVNFSAHVTVKFDGWPCKTIGHLFYATSSFLHHFVPIGEFKLEVQSGNAQSGSNSEPCDLEIWWMTLQNNRAPLLCYFQAICIIS